MRRECRSRPGPGHGPATASVRRLDSGREASLILGAPDHPGGGGGGAHYRRHGRPRLRSGAEPAADRPAHGDRGGHRRRRSSSDRSRRARRADRLRRARRPIADATARRRGGRAARGAVGRHQRLGPPVDERRDRRFPPSDAAYILRNSEPAGAQHELVHLRPRPEHPVQAAVERADRRGGAGPDVGRQRPPLRRHRGAAEHRRAPIPTPIPRSTRRTRRWRSRSTTTAARASWWTWPTEPTSA